MKRFMIGGILIVVGAIVGMTVSCSHYKKGDIYCICVDSGGGVDWVGNCPAEVENVLMQKYKGHCP